MEVPIQRHEGQPQVVVVRRLAICRQDRALLKAVAVEAETDDSPVGFFEGEEEAGSTNLGRYLEEYADLIEDIDVWLLFDGPVHQSGRPLLSFGVRGVTGMEITVYGPIRGLHSGHYGNWAPVPGQMLANLLASMKDDDGRVLIESFYDTVEPLGELDFPDHGRDIVAVDKRNATTLPANDEVLVVKHDAAFVKRARAEFDRVAR